MNLATLDWTRIEADLDAYGCAATGPLLIVLAYSFLKPGPYGDVVWTFSPDAWVGVFLERDIFDDTLSLADAHVRIFLRSTGLSLLTTLLTLLVGFPTAYFIATRPEERRELWLFLITIPFWTNLLIRTFAILEIIRNEGAQWGREGRAADSTFWASCGPETTAAMDSVIALHQRYEHEARNVILAALGSTGHPKVVVVTDDDVDIYDMAKVWWAILTRSQPGEDVVIIDKAAGGQLDPSAPSPFASSVMGIDATRPLGRPFPEVVRVPGVDRLPDPRTLVRDGRGSR